jgi:hypothetical protein
MFVFCFHRFLSPYPSMLLAFLEQRHLKIDLGLSPIRSKQCARHVEQVDWERVFEGGSGWRYVRGELCR